MTPKEEMDLWFPENEIKLKAGGTLKVPKLSWKKEAKFFKMLSSLLKGIPENKDLQNLSPTDALALLSTLLDTFPDKVTSFLAEFLEKEESWIEENLCFEDVRNILVPLVRRFGKSLEDLFGGLPLPK